MPRDPAVTTTELRRFVVLAHELNFTRAARRLHITQQVLSSQIKHLEQEIGAALFTRSTHRVELTPSGAEFLSATTAALESLDRGISLARRKAASGQHVLRIGFLAHANDLQMPALRVFETRHPEITVAIKSHRFDDPSNGLLAGETDVALLAYPPVHPQIVFVPLVDEPRICLVPADHPLAQQRELRPEDLADLPAIVIEGHDHDPLVKAWTDTHTLADLLGERPVGAVVSTAQEWLLAAANGRGFTTAPASVLRFSPYPGLVAVPVTGTSPLTLGVGWIRARKDVLIDEFVQLVQELADGTTPADVSPA
ncbi:LysR substrate-binding domain-containing protein [Amycolatopsis rhabdoformis]|uniref:LysR substrate-binding domain-containing protein n=1 Tax=Amycolatopsis rhabdoformis TaxID=1448059 RepID=A0ABZ1IID6_9PSEU|nr:LysR substrate-binding domain-containing protein [Amycolatopsis rhabdoformis]WSE33536.1 LysR substrate-binding domain-containing protein [Amycolatopsis rhabdoformis]